MDTPLSALHAVRRGFAATFSNFGAFLVLAIVLAVPADLVRDLSFNLFQGLFTSYLPARGITIDPQQVVILAMAAADVPGLLVSCLFAAFAIPAAYYLYLKHEAGESPSLGAAANFGLLRWRRVIWPYTAAMLVIWLGSIVVIPGILYTIFYAFVVAVATLDDKARRPLDRSTKLTWGRRGRIFRIYLLFIPWWGWYATFGPLLLMEQPLVIRLAAEIINEFIGLVTTLCFLQLYQERMAELERKARDGAGNESPAT